MEAVVEHLVKLQSLDLDRARLNQELKALPSEIAQAQARLTAAESHSAEVSAALNREETLRTRLERDTATHRQKASKFRSQHDAVTTPEQSAAIEHEVQFEAAEAERLENEEYASLERTEAHETELAQARAQVEQLAAELEGVRARVAMRQKELAAEIAALGAARDAVRAALDADWLARFDRIATSRGTGIARAENQQCLGCRMGIRPQVWNQLREGELLTCDSCSRLLYWDPAIVPTAKEPQPEVPADAGRAPRKPRQAGA